MHWTIGDPAVILLIIGYLVWFVSVLRHRLHKPHHGSMSERLSKLGLGILLVPAVVAVATLPTNVRLAIGLIASGLALAGWTFLPRHLRSKMLPLVLVGSGLFTLLVLRAFVDSGYTLAEFNSVPTLLRVGTFPQILLLQAYAMIAAGLWLAWRAIDKNGPVAKLLLREPPRIAGRPGRPRWGLLLIPVLAIGAELLGRGYWFHFPGWALAQAAVIALVAFLLVIGFPAVAADLALAGLVLFGLYGIALGALWPTHVPLPQAYTLAVHYGPVWVDNRVTAFGAGFVGLAITGFGLWLAPRALDDRTRALFRSAADADLATRVVRLTRTRADAVDSAAAELRRLERDLHDGAQARLVALGMSLRAAEYLIPTSPELAATLVAEARQTSARVLDELRDLVRGICPPVLADRGLADAVRALALDTPLPTEVDIEMPGRPDLPVESACYFAVAEALANAVKHSGARQVQIRIWHANGSLRITVIDDGCGGADAQRGTGLLGLERRLATFDGVLALNSPPGGPTTVAIEVPCALSPPRVSS
jgi:signal transduction histidine kinase